MRERERERERQRERTLYTIGYYDNTFPLKLMSNVEEHTMLLHLKKHKINGLQEALYVKVPCSLPHLVQISR